MRKRKAKVVVWLNANGLLKLALSVAMVLLVVLLFTYELPSTRTWSHWTMPLSGRVIAIDPGHGGPDGGAVSRGGLVEKDVTLFISLYLRDYLQQAGALVVLTRDDDRDLARPGTTGYSRRKTEDLLNRVQLIQSKQADLLVSIHLNSIASPQWRGAQTFYYPTNPEGKKLATAVQEEIRASLNNTDRQPKTEEAFYLLKSLQLPASLVEVGFLSNPEEAELLADPLYQKKLAESIYRGILRYSAE